MTECIAVKNRQTDRQDTKLHILVWWVISYLVRKALIFFSSLPVIVLAFRTTAPCSPRVQTSSGWSSSLPASSRTASSFIINWRGSHCSGCDTDMEDPGGWLCWPWSYTSCRQVKHLFVCWCRVGFSAAIFVPRRTAERKGDYGFPLRQCVRPSVRPCVRA